MKNYKLPILLLTILLVLPVALAEPEEVSVSIYILNLGKFDISSGTYTADFYLSMKCEEECSPENFEFMNGRANSVDKIIDTPTEKFYRMQANLNSPVDLKGYPFDKQKLQVIIEDKKSTINDIIYKPSLEESGVDKTVMFPGWNFKGWTAEVTEHNYPGYGETYSQYVFTMDVARIVVNSFVKTFLPIIFIVLVVMSSFIMGPDKVTTRLGMVGSALVASVMFHVSISNQLPPVGYTTFADKFMGLTYFVLLSSFVLNISLMGLQEHKKTDLVEKLHKITEYSVFIVVPILYLALFTFFT